ncbi:hypothetical protein [Ethanoligenens sp.]|uniref:hypothetical protein n=1 Tax=Ethanoligenens sp. TaxID=2099655 RepID=UPI0039E89230
MKVSPKESQDNFNRRANDSIEIERAFKKLSPAAKARIKDIIMGALIIQETEDKATG